MELKWIGILLLSLVVVGASSFWGLFENKVNFNDEVKPILNKHCMACHGGVKKAGGVSFLFEEDMCQPAKSGKVAVIAGDADASEMMRRITLPDGHEDKMPKEGVPLTKQEIETLRKWINQGASWGEHWAYIPVKRPDVPKIGNLLAQLGIWKDEETAWAKNEIDHFVLEKLNEQGLTPAAEADKATLIRRVSLDLTGLPPTEQQVQQFLNDNSANAYEKLIDTLLASPHYGERWTALWLDLARYADTKGYERDPGRSIWRYRDWLIKAFNQDKPYDHFLREQLAGDLMPKNAEGLPNDDLLIATGFHRNTMNNDEGGTVDEEFRVAAVIDRVNTTWDVFQGTTFGCIQCHSHPYDPIVHEEYYKYMAFFNNTRDEDVPSDTPTLRFYDSKDSIKIATVKNWIQAHPHLNALSASTFNRFVRTLEPKFNSHDFDQHQDASLLDAKYFGIMHKGSARWKNVNITNQNRLLIAVGTAAEHATLRLHQDSLGGKVVMEKKLPKTNSAWSDTVLILPVNADVGKHNFYWTVVNPQTPKDWIMIKWATFQPALPATENPDFVTIEKLYADILTGNVPNTPIFWEGEGDLARVTQVFDRGNFSVKREVVKPDIPQIFKKNFKVGALRNRLDLANWMVSPQNPLTARVAVNRFWEQLFGIGIVETVEDFGSQGIAPTHRKLLDWLAAEFVETHHWGIKKLLKQVLLSATYRQSSKVTPDKLAKDPYNKWLSRGARVRLSAEQLRDQALAVSGLLSAKMYGPSVMPYQPDNIWQSPYDGAKWQLSGGEDRYRRAIYTYWKRTSPYPSMLTFDAPSREFCQLRRIRTNTPLQALVTLNDPAHLEAAHCLAQLVEERKKTPSDQIAEAYRLLKQQPISIKKQKKLLQLYQQTLTAYQQDSTAIFTFLLNHPIKNAQLAALTITVNSMLNLDEVLTKE